jgi:hypothetical protein
MAPRPTDPVQHLARVSEQDLLRETRRLRRLARELLFDRGRTEDVVQEAWLAALRGGPADGWSLRDPRVAAAARVADGRRGLNPHGCGQTPIDMVVLVPPRPAGSSTGLAQHEAS